MCIIPPLNIYAFDLLYPELPSTPVDMIVNALTQPREPDVTRPSNGFKGLIGWANDNKAPVVLSGSPQMEAVQLNTKWSLAVATASGPP